MIPDVGRRGQRYLHLADVFADEGFGGDGFPHGTLRIH